MLVQSQPGPDGGETKGVTGDGSRLPAVFVLAATLITPMLLLWLWSQPRPVSSQELPPLLLDPAAVEAQEALDASRASTAPSTDDAERERRASCRERNLSELSSDTPPGVARARRAETVDALERLVAEHGEEVRSAVRAADLQRAMAALTGEVRGRARAAELGGLLTTYERYGMVEDARQRAPTFILRTAFKARWNAFHDRPLTEGFSPVERQAHWGWLALRAEGVSVATRLEAVGRYAEAGGVHAEEARATLLLQSGDRSGAAAAFEAAHAAHPTFRLRNRALAALSEQAHD